MLFGHVHGQQDQIVDVDAGKHGAQHESQSGRNRCLTEVLRVQVDIESENNDVQKGDSQKVALLVDDIDQDA